MDGTDGLLILGIQRRAESLKAEIPPSDGETVCGKCKEGAVATIAPFLVRL